MTTDDKAALHEYKRLAEECTDIREEMDALGRTDVPLDDPQHIDNADPSARRRWFELCKQLWLVESDRDQAMYIAMPQLKTSS